MSSSCQNPSGNIYVAGKFDCLSVVEGVCTTHGLTFCCRNRYGQPKWILPRKVITRGIYHDPVLEVMPPRLRVHYLASDGTRSEAQDPAQVTVSSKDTVRNVVSVLARAVRTTDTDSPTRIWKLPDGENYPYLDYPVSKLKEGATIWEADGRLHLDEALINSGDAFVVEFQTAQGWLIPDPSSLTQVSGTSTPLSSTSAAAPTNKLFGTSNFFDQLQAKSSPTSTDIIKSDSSALKPAVSIKSGLTTRAKVSKIEPGTLGLVNM